MGGTLAFTLRKRNGEEFRMSRHTNWMPFAIDNIDLVHKRPSHIKLILKQWLEDQDKPKKDRHWAYHSPYLAPAEYGLVVVDLKKDKILDCNYYHAFGKMHSVHLSNALFGKKTVAERTAAIKKDQRSDLYPWYSFFKERRIKDVLYFNRRKKAWESTGDNVRNWSLKKMVENFLMPPNRRALCPYFEFVFDMSPFEVVTFPENAQGFTNMRQAVLDLGFKLNKEEEKRWKARIARYKSET